MRFLGPLRMTPLILTEGVVGVTVKPPFSRLSRGDDRMLCGIGVFAGMPIWRAVATKCDPALLTRAQMHPRRADFNTLSTLRTFGLLDRVNRVEMRAPSVRHYRLNRLAWLQVEENPI